MRRRSGKPRAGAGPQVTACLSARHRFRMVASGATDASEEKAPAARVSAICRFGTGMDAASPTDLTKVPTTHGRTFHAAVSRRVTEMHFRDATVFVSSAWRSLGHVWEFA